MKTQKYLLLMLLMLIPVSHYSFAHVLDQLPGYSEQSKLHEPDKVVELYLQAVRRGELIVFDQILDDAMIRPVRVEYVYQLDKSVPTVKVYSKITQPISVPGQPDCGVLGVSAIIDTDGSIIETEAHIWQQ